MDKESFEKLDAIFNPRSVAVVGVSKDKGKAGSAYFQGILESGFKGKFYPVNSDCDEVFGIKAYKSVKDIPGPVDNVVVVIPKAGVIKVLDDCAAKGVRMSQLFTAGYSELTGNFGREEEKQLARIAREGGFRLVGPNCIGVSRPALNLPLGPEGLLARPGHVGLISQSGSLCLRVAQLGTTEGVGFSKIASFGNGADLDSLEFLEYLGLDPQTRVIGAYLEGVKDGRRFLEVLGNICRTKPVVVWKGGTTLAGARAAASHTGALAGSEKVWRTALSQCGAVQVDTLEEAADTLLGFQTFMSLSGKRATVVSGLADGGGGESVVAGDICIRHGLEVPAFTRKTQEGLLAFLPRIGSIVHNPLDVSQALSDPQRVIPAIELAATDPNVDIVIVEAVLDFLYQWAGAERVETLFKGLMELPRKVSKPFVAVLPPGGYEAERAELGKRLLAVGIPAFPNLERAVKTLARVHWYYEQDRK